MTRITRLLAAILLVIALPLQGVAGVVGAAPLGAFFGPGVTDRYATDGAGARAQHGAERVAALDEAPQAAQEHGAAVVEHAVGAERPPCAGSHGMGDGEPCAELNAHSNAGGSCTAGCGVVGVPTRVALHLSLAASHAPPLQVSPLRLGDPPPSPERPPRRPSF